MWWMRKNNTTFLSKMQYYSTPRMFILLIKKVSYKKFAHPPVSPFHQIYANCRGATRGGRGRLVWIPAILLSVSLFQCKDVFYVLSSVLKQKLEIYWRTTKTFSTKMCLVHHTIWVENVSLSNVASACFTDKINCKKLTWCVCSFSI